jgi:hypothetical protein
MLINMKHYTSGPSNNIRLRYGGNSQNSASKAAQFVKLRAQRLDITYDRIFFFADLNTPGKCFVIIAETVQMSEFLMTYAQQGIGIGNIFAIIEPDQVTRAMKGGMPLIETSKALYPVLTCGPDQVVPLIIPEMGKQNYFYLRNVKVELNRVEAARASCNGTLCDRQNAMTRGGSCGCLYFNRTCSVVLDMTVTFTNVDINGYHSQYSVPHFRSWRVSKLFIKPTAMTADNQVFFAHMWEIRNVAAAIKDKVNEEGGWTIVGWYRKGEITDASAPTNEAGNEIASDSHPIHINYLYPTNENSLNGVIKYPRDANDRADAQS